MTQKDKELLLKDILGRLPYGVKVLYEEEIYQISEVSIFNETITIWGERGYPIEVEIQKVKPYLFPLSSMTDEQKEELFFNYIHNDIYFDDFTDYFLAGELWHDICVSMNRLPELIDWLIKNHFDYNGLIPKGLANDATGLNIY